jgi:Flp pilus assembly protein TadG
MARNTSDQGAALIHVAVTLIGLFMFTGFVVDYGTFWVARNQAQNAADAGALAGAVARLYDDTTSPPASKTSGKVYDSVTEAVARNVIWGVPPPASTVTIDWTCPDTTTNCVAVDVYRDGTNSSSALPTFFMGLANVTSQGVRAHAVAEVTAANGTGCLRPWFMPDPGFVTPADYGQVVTLHSNLAPSGYEQLNVGSGGSGIRTAIEQCATIGSSSNFYIGATVPTKPGGTNGPEAQGVQSLFDWDPGATVSGTGTSTQVTGSCATSGGCTCSGNPGNVCPNGPYVSPRVVVVAMCNGATDGNCALGGPSGGDITITNFLTFFITGCDGTPNVCRPGGHAEIDATLVSTAGASFSSGGSPTAGESFIKIINLIR